MSSQLINLTLQLVTQEIEEVFDVYPMLCQTAFSNYEHELRQKLIIYVLNQIPNYYAFIEEGQELPENFQSLYSSLKEQVDMRILIWRSLLHIFREDSDWISPNIDQQNNLITRNSLSDNDLCRNCQFFSNNYYLKCAVHPDMTLTKQALNCPDYQSSD